MPAAKRTARRQTVGKAFKPIDEKPVGAAFSTSSRATMPPVVLMDRASLAILRPLAEKHGWPRKRSVGDALERAQRAGELSLAPLVAHYGVEDLSGARFIALPVLDGYEEQDVPRTFHARGHDGVVVLYPPGEDPAIPPISASIILTLNCLFFPFAGRQEDALAATEFEVLFGGAKGGAKSETLVAMAVRQIEAPAYKALIFRKTKQALEEIEARCNTMYPPLGGVWNESDRTYTFRSGAKVELGFCETKDDAERYQGREFGFIGGDEFAQVADARVLPILIAECRCRDPEVVRMIRLTANPIGPGVALLKRRFLAVCGNDGSKIHFDEYDIEGLGKVRLSRRFIPSRVTDNPVYRDDPVYMATLHSLPDRLKKLLLYGDWEAALGSALDELSWAKHWVGLSDPRHPGEPKPHWPLLGFFDWGFAHRWAFIIVALDERGDAWVVDTLWGSREYADDIAARLWKWVGEDPRRRPRPIWASKQCFQRYQAQVQNVPTFAEQFAKAGLPMMQAAEDPGSRITGLNNLRQWLAWQRSGEGAAAGEPRLRLLETHGNRILFHQLESMVPDPDNPEDVLKVDYDPDAEEEGINASGDDGYDALKMFANLRPLSAKTPEQKQVKRERFDDGLDKLAKQSERAHLKRRRPARGRGF